MKYLITILATLCLVLLYFFYPREQKSEENIQHSTPTSSIEDKDLSTRFKQAEQSLDHFESFLSEYQSLKGDFAYLTVEEDELSLSIYPDEIRQIIKKLGTYDTLFLKSHFDADGKTYYGFILKDNTLWFINSHSAGHYPLSTFAEWILFYFDPENKEQIPNPMDSISKTILSPSPNFTAKAVPISATSRKKLLRLDQQHRQHQPTISFPTGNNIEYLAQIHLGNSPESGKTTPGILLYGSQGKIYGFNYIHELSSQNTYTLKLHNLFSTLIEKMAYEDEGSSLGPFIETLVESFEQS